MSRSTLYTAPQLSVVVKNTMGKKVGPHTIRKILNKNEFHARTPLKKPYISMKNQCKRLQYALNYVSKILSFWDSIIWSDETKVNLFGSDGHKKVWRKKGEALKTKNLLPTVKHAGGSVVVWACFGAKWV